MKLSTDRILTTHTGSLPRAQDLTTTLEELDAGRMPDPGAFEARVDEILSKADGEQRVVVSRITPLEGVKPLDIRRARVFVRKGADLEPGDVISAPFRFYQVPGPAVPGARRPGGCRGGRGVPVAPFVQEGSGLVARAVTVEILSLRKERHS